MKKRFNAITKLLLFCSIIFLASCVNDDALDKQDLHNGNKISSRYVNFNEVKNNLKVLNKFNTIKEKISKTKNISLNQNQRLVYLSQFDFFIETDDILLIEKDGYKSYTFPIYRNNEVNKTENLVITESNGLISSYISKYDLSDSDKNNILNNQFVDLKDKTEITSLESRGSGEPCYELVYTPVEWNEQGQVTVSMVIAVEVDCPDNGGSGGGSGSGDSGSGSGNGWYGGGGSGSGDTGGIGNTGGGDTGGIGNTGVGGPGGGSNYPGGGSTDNPPSGGNTGDPLNADTNLTDGNGNPIITSPVLNISRTEIKLINTLTPLQHNWWIDPYNSQQTKVDIINYLNNNISNNIINPEALALAQELITLSIKEPVQADVNKINNIILQAKIQDKFYNNIDDAFLLDIDQYMDMEVANIDPILMAQLKSYFTVQCAVLRYNHPDWSDLKIYWEASKEMLHITLDIFGLVPVFGEVADLTNGVLYTIEGDGVNATLSYASSVPLAGWAAVTTKYAVKIVDASQTATTIATRIKLTWKVVGNTIDFGSSSQLRKVLGLVGNGIQAHHLMPWALRNNNVLQKAAKSGSAFHMNEALNGIAVATWRNQPNHNIYNNLINNKLNLFNTNNPNASPMDCYNFVSDLIHDVRTWVINNPNSHLNDLILP
ncbi:MAG: hypothetical protein HC854_10530 [Flavobacterium sp.]|nr:hypothetical protein [Flavobacterium sp.]